MAEATKLQRAEALRAAGAHGEAVDAFVEAVETDPENPAVYAAFGAMLLEMGAVKEAAAAFGKATRLRPDAPAAWFRDRGVALQAAGRDLEALKAFRRAAAEPGNEIVFANIGDLLARNGDRRGAAEAFTRVPPDSPNFAAAAANAGHLFRLLGEPERARSWYEQALMADSTDSAGARLGLSLLNSGTGAAELPETYVRRLFDDYAGHYDADLLGRLDYRVPEAIAEAVVDRIGAAPRVLDLGCGTGLCAAALLAALRRGERGPPSRLIGVDIAPAMVRAARDRGFYHRVDEAELITWLGEREEMFDLVLGGEVLNYLGALDAPVAHVRDRLAPGGLFVFSLEDGEAAGAVLDDHMRYRHGPGAARAAADAADMEVIGEIPLRLRRHEGESLSGRVVVLQRR